MKEIQFQLCLFWFQVLSKNLAIKKESRKQTAESYDKADMLNQFVIYTVEENKEKC